MARAVVSGNTSGEGRGARWLGVSVRGAIAGMGVLWIGLGLAGLAVHVFA